MFHIYPASKCEQTIFHIIKSPLLSSKKFDMFFKNWLNKPIIYTYQARGAIYHILKYLKEEFQTKRVIIPKYICKDVISVIKEANLKIIYADTDLKTLSIDFSSVKIQKNDIIIYTNVFGLKSTIPKNIYRKNVFIIEDNAQTYLEKPSKNSDFTVYSLGEGKGITSSGGGILVINNMKYKNLVDKIKLTKPNISKEISKYITYLLWKLKHFKLIYFIGKKIFTNTKKNRSSKIKNKNLSICKISKKIALPALKKHNTQTGKMLAEKIKLKTINNPENSNYFYLNLFVKNRDSLETFLKFNRIFTSTFWKYILNETNPKEYPNTYYILNNLIQLPINPEYTKNDILYISDKINNWCLNERKNII